MPTTWLDTVLRQTRRAGKFPYPHQSAVFLDNPLRRWMANPSGLADRLALKGTERVLELGPGGFSLFATSGTRWQELIRLVRLPHEA